ncbi:hypothetical protein QRD43_03490 [Pelomonas sp. APW6]|uniref:Transcriptional regulator n=1 Tax=Roseateles subflavus TaxID=3053353 RepID=A0ABT7LDL2_9BURK|nr:hypothetical protein [Pelomonas sp. APW6]MDL5030959.1 hypothetical protein [Pelomonas sp. APW6]
MLQKTFAHSLRLDAGQLCAVERGTRGPLDAASLERAAALLSLSASERRELEWAARHDRLVKHAIREGAWRDEVELYSLCLEALHNLRPEQRIGLVQLVRRFNDSAKELASLTPVNRDMEDLP